MTFTELVDAYPNVTACLAIALLAFVLYLAGRVSPPPPPEGHA